MWPSAARNAITTKKVSFNLLKVTWKNISIQKRDNKRDLFYFFLSCVERNSQHTRADGSRQFNRAARSASGASLCMIGRIELRKRVKATTFSFHSKASDWCSINKSNVQRVIFALICNYRLYFTKYGN